MQTVGAAATLGNTSSRQVEKKNWMLHDYSAKTFSLSPPRKEHMTLSAILKEFCEIVFLLFSFFSPAPSDNNEGQDAQFLSYSLKAEED